VLRGETANVEVKLEAEKKYVFHMQDELKKRVWSAGCVSVCAPLDSFSQIAKNSPSVVTITD
jgi:hypothetical protein